MAERSNGGMKGQNRVRVYVTMTRHVTRCHNRRSPIATRNRCAVNPDPAKPLQNVGTVIAPRFLLFFYFLNIHYRPKVAFTKDDDALLMKYIATYNPQPKGRLGTKLYERLVENVCAVLPVILCN